MPIESALHGQAATSLYRELGDRVGLFRSLVTVTISDFSHLSAAQREAWREAQSLEDPGWPACLKLILVWARARVQRIDGEYEQSLASLREVIQLARADGDPGIEARALAHVAEMEFIVGEPALASQHALALAARMRNARLYGELPALLRIAAAAQLNQGDVEGARQAAVEGWPLARRGGAESAWFDVLALLAAAEGRADTAARLIGAADADHAARRSARDLIAAASLRDAERRVGDVLGPDLLQHLRSEGSGMWLEEIERMAFARA
jgi:ATP/maltotriose-dependent transcriptional regulator MalT